MALSPHQRLRREGGETRGGILHAAPDIQYEQIIIMAGTVNILLGDSREDVKNYLDIPVHAVSEKYPQAQIIVISPYQVRRLIEQGCSPDGIHLDEKGHRVLWNTCIVPDSSSAAPWQPAQTPRQLLHHPPESS